MLTRFIMSYCQDFSVCMQTHGTVGSYILVFLHVSLNAVDRVGYYL